MLKQECNKVSTSIELINLSINNALLVMLKSHCAESTAERGRGHSCSVGGSFLVILAMTMTMIMNLNSVLLIRVTSAGQHMFKTFVFPMRILFIPGYAHWKRVVIFFVAQLMCCILDILTVYSVIRACNISQEKCEWGVNVTL